MLKNTLNKIYFIFNVILPILLGGLIYTLYRSKNILLFDWYNYLGVSQNIIQFRKIFNPNDLVFSNFLTQNLPDGLWVYSFASCMLLIWRDHQSTHKYLYIIIPIFLSITSEFLQLYNVLSGTYDIMDIQSYVLFSILAKVSFKIIYKKL